MFDMRNYHDSTSVVDECDNNNLHYNNCTSISGQCDNNSMVSTAGEDNDIPSSEPVALLEAMLSLLRLPAPPSTHCNKRLHSVTTQHQYGHNI